MNSYTGSSKAKTGGCGCGGSTPTVAAKSSCGGGCGCSSCQNEDFVRPNFFAGQLLTEEDLQSLNNYVVAKNRLHNRNLFGAGVVCGLDVTCDPCGGGKVTVNPGYALDCCGNDITVACATELNINKMVRDLRRDLLGGLDCGDPCDDKSPDTGPALPTAAGAAVRDAARAAAQPLNLGQSAPDDAAKVPEIVRHYCLYLNYCEEMSDPVSPYATDEACGYQTCEPTRVREGFRFELRCPPKPKQPDDLLSRICQCIGDRASAKRALADARTMVSYLDGIKFKSSAIIDARQSKEYVASLAEAVKAAKQASADAKTEATIETIDKAVEATRTLNMLTARLRLADEATLTALAGEKTFAKTLTNARAQMEAASTLSEAIKAQPRSGLDRAFAEGVIDSAAEFSKMEVVVDPNAVVKKFKTTATTGAEATATTTEPPPAAPPSAAVPAPATAPSEAIAGIEGWSIGAFSSSKFAAAQAESLKSMREELLERLENSPHLTDCELRTEVRAIQIPDSPQNADAGTWDDYTLWEEPARKLVDAINRYFKNCVCAAINPPCQPCDDMGVLLACLEVKDCEVLRICNLERTFVLTGPALRYWFALDRLGDKIEEFCCPTPKYASDLKNQYLAPDPSAKAIGRLMLLAAKFCAGDEDEGKQLKSSLNSIISQRRGMAAESTLDEFGADLFAPLMAGMAALSDTGTQTRLLDEVSRLKAIVGTYEERFAKLEGGK